MANTTILVDGATYYGILVSEAGCASSPTAVPVNLYLSNNELDIAQLMIYPNPTRDVLNIQYKEIIDSIEVYSLVGHRVMQIDVNSTETVLDLSPLAAHAYMMKIRVGDNYQFFKVVKK